MCVKCAEGVIHHPGETVFKPYPAGMDADGETEMLGKKFIYKRSVMIALAVVALMTLTAGVAAATAGQVKFKAEGAVSSVGLPAGGSVLSEFNYGKKDKLKSVTISTFGEGVGGYLADVKCKKKNELCGDVESLLESNGLVSFHDSVATLKVQGTPKFDPKFPFAPEVIKGKLNGNLGSALFIDQNPTAPPMDLYGSADLKIKSKKSAKYGCLTALGFASIATCVTFAETEVAGFIGVDPVLIPVELHVKDTGTFWASDSPAPEFIDPTVIVEGDITVVVDSVLVFDGSGIVPVTSGTIKIKKGIGTFIPGE